MEVNEILSYLGGYFKSTIFDLDITKIADLAELSEDEVIDYLEKLKLASDIDLENNKVELKTIIPQNNKEFNDLYKPVETFEWKRHEKLIFDK